MLCDTGWRGGSELMLSPSQTGVHACPALLRASEQLWVVGKDSTAFTAGAGRGQAARAHKTRTPDGLKGNSGVRATAL